jgi:UDP-N-acetylmuramoyl-L-alanyl-D-glutamate--2,6-diaminopimelate ligase
MRHRLDGILTIGVTGTKGKTSTAEFVAQLLEAQGLLVALSTTESARIGSRYYEGFWSVPELHRFVGLATRAGVDCVVIELCSSALRWDLHTAFSLDVAILTNIGTDHIRDHGNRSNYIATKQKMFRDLAQSPGRSRPVAILNADDPCAASFRRCLRPEVAPLTYGVKARRRAASPQHLIARNIASHADGTRFTVDGFTDGPMTCETRLYGTFNVANVLAAITCTAALGYTPRSIVRSATSLVPPPGRFDIVATPTRTQPGVVVDYAHTPESLESALRAARLVTTRGRVHVVFGCGGDAYKAKRPMMGAIASRLADRVVITNDNPRREDPAAIVRDVLAGVPRSARAATSVELDRRLAIEAAIRTAADGDVVLIAGKGNERTQEVGDRSVAFSDGRVARRALDVRLRHGSDDALTAAAAIVLDRYGAPVFGHHAEMLRAPASLVKLMTLYLAFEALARGRVTPDTTVTLSAYAAMTPHPRLRLRAGERLRLATLLQAIGLRSSNVAATAVAELIAGDEATFVDEMNARAAALGLTSTRFATSHGLPHRHQQTTALDMARLLRHLCRKHPAAIALLGRPAFRFRGACYPRRIALLAGRDILGVKTGFTWEAGYNLAVAARSRGAERFVVVLGATSRARSFTDVRTLLTRASASPAA